MLWYKKGTAEKREKERKTNPIWILSFRFAQTKNAYAEQRMASWNEMLKSNNQVRTNTNNEEHLKFFFKFIMGYLELLIIDDNLFCSGNQEEKQFCRQKPPMQNPQKGSKSWKEK